VRWLAEPQRARRHLDEPQYTGTGLPPANFYIKTTPGKPATGLPGVRRWAVLILAARP